MCSWVDAAVTVAAMRELWHFQKGRTTKYSIISHIEINQASIKYIIVNCPKSARVKGFYGVKKILLNPGR